MSAAAIYARKSTEQNVADEAKSVVRQVENARAFAAGKGWTVREEHIFVDDGKSGAEWEKRPDFMRMMGALEPRAPFQFLVVSEQKTIGREMTRTANAIMELDEAGVEIWGYLEDRRITPRDLKDKLLSAVQGFSDEDLRVKTSQRMHEAHVRLASRGFVAGGRVYGYRNRPVYNGVDESGNPLRSHVDREIEPSEAAVVRRIFKMYGDGSGLKAIARDLNSRPAHEAPRPKYTKQPDGLPGLGAWSPSTVRAILRRPIYRGVVVWNKSRKRDRWGQAGKGPRRERRRPEADWVSAQREDLRVVPDSLWTLVQSRFRELSEREVRFASGRL